MQSMDEFDKYTVLLGLLGVLIVVDLIWVACAVIYPLLLMIGLLVIVISALASNAGWVFFFMRSQESRISGLKTGIPIISGLVIFFLAVYRFTEVTKLPDFFFQVFSLAWLFRLSGGVIVAWVLSILALLVRKDRREWQFSAIASSVAVACLLYTLNPQSNVLASSFKDLVMSVQAIVGYLGFSSGICLLVPEVFDQFRRPQDL